MTETFSRFCPTCRSAQTLAGHHRGHFATCPTCYNLLDPVEGEDAPQAPAPSPPIIRDAVPVEDDLPYLALASPPIRDVEPVEDEPVRPMPVIRRSEPPIHDVELVEDDRAPAATGPRRFWDEESDRDRPSSTSNQDDLSLPWGELPRDVQDRLDRELRSTEQIVWIGKADPKLHRLRRIPWSAFGGALLVLGVTLLILTVTADHNTLVAGLLASFMGGVVVLFQTLELMLPSSAVYVLTSRRALSVSRGLFGFVVMEFGPDRAAYPRIYRSLFLPDGGDLIMRTMIFVNYSGRGGMSLTTHDYGFMGIRRLDEVDALLRRTLGNPNYEPGSRSAFGVLRVISWAYRSLLVLLLLAVLGVCIWFSYLPLPNAGGNPNPNPNNPNPAPKKKKRLPRPEAPAMIQPTTEQTT